MSSIAVGRPFALGRQPWKTLDPFLFCVFHDDKFPKSAPNSLGPDPALLRGRDLTMDFSYKEGWSMYHGERVPGFPGHPHRGFETITCSMKGLVDHFDSMGATGRYGNGDVQWMTAGGGVQHSEMFPLVNDKEPNHAELFQIWLNLPQKSKDANPFFEMFWEPEVPKVTVDDAEVTVVAGQLNATVPKRPPPDSWAADPENDVAVWIVRLTGKEGGKVTLPAARTGAAVNRTAYFFRGTGATVKLEDQTGTRGAASLGRSEGLQLDPTASVTITAAAGGTAEVLILQGKPIKEPVVQRGPFVATSQEDMANVLRRYQHTEFGGWPWKSHDATHPREKPRFAKRPGAKEEEFPPSRA